MRNRGTIGGALAHADPAADYPATVLALDAEIVAQGPQGRRTVPVTEFFTGLFSTALAPDELLVEVRVPRLGPGAGGAYLKRPNKASHYAVVGVAAVVRLEGGRVSRLGVGVTGAGSQPGRAPAVEQALLGEVPTATPSPAPRRAWRRGSTSSATSTARPSTGRRWPASTPGGRCRRRCAAPAALPANGGSSPATTSRPGWGSGGSPPEKSSSCFQTLVEEPGPHGVPVHRQARQLRRAEGVRRRLSLRLRLAGPGLPSLGSLGLGSLGLGPAPGRDERPLRIVRIPGRLAVEAHGDPVREAGGVGDLAAGAGPVLDNHGRFS